ncbi:hypothetical protein PCE1_000525 [Barthelona sp. PCE]
MPRIKRQTTHIPEDVFGEPCSLVSSSKESFHIERVNSDPILEFSLGQGIQPSVCGPEFGVHTIVGSYDDDDCNLLYILKRFPADPNRFYPKSKRSGPHYLHIYALEDGNFIHESKRWIKIPEKLRMIEYIDEMTFICRESGAWFVHRLNDCGEISFSWFIGDKCRIQIIGSFIVTKKRDVVTAHTLTMGDGGEYCLISEELYRNDEYMLRCCATDCFIDNIYESDGYIRFFARYAEDGLLNSLNMLEFFPALSSCKLQLQAISFLKLSVSQRECVLMAKHPESWIFVVLKDEKISFTKVSCSKRLSMIPREFSLEFDYLNTCKDMFFIFNDNICRVNIFRPFSSILIGVDSKKDLLGCLSTSLLFTTRYGILLVDLAAKTCMFDKKKGEYENIESFETLNHHIQLSSGECFCVSQHKSNRKRMIATDYIYNIKEFNLEQGEYPSVCIQRTKISVNQCPYVSILDEGLVHVNSRWIEQGFLSTLEYYDFADSKSYLIFSGEVRDRKVRIEHVTEDIIIIVTKSCRIVFRRDSRTKWVEECRLDKDIFVNPFNTESRVSFNHSSAEFTFTDSRACSVERSSFIAFVDAEIALFSDGIYFIGSESVKLVDLGEFTHFINAKGDFSIVPISDLEKKIFSITRYHTSGSEIVETECFGTTVEDFFSSCSYHSMAGYFRDHHGRIDVEPTRVIDLCSFIE